MLQYCIATTCAQLQQRDKINQIKTDLIYELKEKVIFIIESTTMNSNDLKFTVNDQKDSISFERTAMRKPNVSSLTKNRYLRDRYLKPIVFQFAMKE